MRQRRPRIRQALLVSGLTAVIIWGVNATATTRQGVNFQVSAQPIPLYVKSLDFLHRNAQYQLFARQLTREHHTDRERVLAVFEWTCRHIPRTPDGWPVVDDHVLNIIIRGHGLEDQMADVFTTLSTYAGVPAFWCPVHLAEGGAWWYPSFAKVDGHWVLFDVANQLVLTDAEGRWLDVEALLADPEALATAGARRMRHGVAYRPYLERLKPFQVPRPLRAELQMPWPRLRHVVGRALGGGAQ